MLFAQKNCVPGFSIPASSEMNGVANQWPATQGYHSDLFDGGFAPVIGAVLPPTILTQVPAGT